MKPSLAFTCDRSLDLPGEEPVRMALTLQVWATREQADIENATIKAALTKASEQIGADLFQEASTTASAPERCLTCRFWESPYGLDDPCVSEAEHGECRRHAPTMRIVSEHCHKKNDWPDMPAQGWCGDYQRHVAAPDEA